MQLVTATQLEGKYQLHGEDTRSANEKALLDSNEYFEVLAALEHFNTFLIVSVNAGYKGSPLWMRIGSRDCAKPGNRSQADRLYIQLDLNQARVSAMHLGGRRFDKYAFYMLCAKMNDETSSMHPNDRPQLRLELDVSDVHCVGANSDAPALIFTVSFGEHGTFAFVVKYDTVRYSWNY